ncbi:MAG: hypothetical protein IIC71_06710 [Acidobacteria bacterium]|nr:hypothetical protein [Acidobacteriota bacterium]
MNREQRIQEARRRAKAGAGERAKERAEAEDALRERIANMTPDEAAALASGINFDSSIKALGHIATPHEWDVAVTAARVVTIEAAKRGETITYGELRVAAYEATSMKVGHNSFGRLAMETNRKTDGCLLSSIIVRASTGTPGSGLESYARSQGFDAPLDALQRQVFDHFK